MAHPPKQIGMRTLMGWGVSGQLIYVVSQLFTLIALTRFASVEDVGVFGLASAIVIPVFFFFNLDMRVNVAASSRSVYSFQDFRTLHLASLLAGFGLILVLAFTLFTDSARMILIILGATKVFESVSGFSYGVFQRYDQMRFVAGSLMLRSIGGTVIFVLLLAQGVAVETAFLAQLIVWATVAIFVDYTRALGLWRSRKGLEGADLGRMLDLAKGSLLLGLTGLLSAVQGNMPRYVIVALLDVIALGQFTVVAYAMQAISTLTMALTQSLVARFNSFIADRRSDALFQTLRKLLGALAGFTVVSVGVSIFAGNWLVSAIFGPDYVGLGGLLVICVLAASLRSVVLILQMCLLAGRQFRLNLLIRMGSTIFMLLACAAGGLWGGLNGIAWGMCAAFVVHITVLAFAVRPLARAQTIAP